MLGVQLQSMSAVCLQADHPRHNPGTGFADGVVGKRGGSFIFHGLDQEREGHEGNHKVEVFNSYPLCTLLPSQTQQTFAQTLFQVVRVRNKPFSKENYISLSWTFLFL